MEDNKKKRGRPCKKELNNEEEKTEPKKRGRKPKIVLEEDNDIEKVQTIKKRGRKPKDKLIENNENYTLPNTKTNLYENIILHIPYIIDKKDEMNFFSSIYKNNILENDLLKYEPTLNEPQPSISNFTNNSEILNFEKLLKDNNTEIKNINLDDSNNKNIDLNESKDVKNEENKINNEEEVSKIFNESNIELKLKIDEIKEKIEQNQESLNKDNRQTLTNFFNQFCKNDNFDKYPSKTDICCWWCCHNFNTIPISLPYKYNCDKFHCYGVFCSFNCAAAYNFNNDDHNSYERYMLLNLLYQKITNKKMPVKINLSPPKELLKSFGGYLSIDEYRKNNITNEKSYKLIMPPIISITPQVEENINYMINNKNDYRLKRKNPIVSKSKTLEKFISS